MNEVWRHAVTAFTLPRLSESVPALAVEAGLLDWPALLVHAVVFFLAGALVVRLYLMLVLHFGILVLVFSNLPDS